MSENGQSRQDIRRSNELQAIPLKEKPETVNEQHSHSQILTQTGQQASYLNHPHDCPIDKIPSKVKHL